MSVDSYKIISDEELEQLLENLPIDQEEALVLLDKHMRYRAEESDNHL